MALGLVAFMFDTAGGVLVAKVHQSVPAEGQKAQSHDRRLRASRRSRCRRAWCYKMAIKEDPQNYLLMQCVGVNVSGQVASVIAGGLLLNLLV